MHFRLQNRIAQRNHRPSALPSTPDDHTGLDFAFIDPQLRSSREGSSSSSTVMDGNFLGNTMPQKQHSPSWMGVDQIMMMNMPPVSDALMSHHQPPRRIPVAPLQQSHHHHASITNLGMAFPQTQSQQYPIPSPNSHVSSPRRSAPSTTSSSSLLPGSRSPSVSGHRSLHEESTSSSSVPSSTAGQFTTTSSSTGTAREPSPAVTGNQGATGGGVTSRFKTILEATKAAGFADFDKMVVAYYTTQFERSSIAAKSLCVDEIEHLETEQVLDPVQMETKEISTAFSWLFNHGDNDYEMQLDRPAESPGGMPRQYLSSLSERGEVAQDSVPHLWSLLTELAGPHSIYCDRIAQMILAILLDARRTQ
ncbi:uncharacterized protein PG998_013584 [Apiospora kogelbergensis]|uniref:uncharacterized protein n=1 Tax=Apiospora kogelbergensis TaxID=1337665 RepID=UPI00312F397A